MNFNGWVPGMRPPRPPLIDTHVDKQFINTNVELQQMFQQYHNQIMKQANMPNEIVSNEHPINDPEPVDVSENYTEQSHNPSYAEVAAHVHNPENLSNDEATDQAHNSETISNVLPVFIEEADMLGVKKSPQRVFIAHIDMYKAITCVIPSKFLKGLQRIRGLWRIYLDSEDARSSLISKGIVFKGRYVQLHARNPRVTNNYAPNSIRIRVKDIPLSADDSQIVRELERYKCVVLNCFRERLRIDNFLTDCQTGDRLIAALPLENPLPRSMSIGKYRATVIHRDQNTQQKSLTCNKCLQEGHKAFNCTNDWVCRNCRKEGHRQDECPEKLEKEECTDTQDNDETHSGINEESVVVDMSGSNIDEDKVENTHIGTPGTPRVTKSGNRSNKSSKQKLLFSTSGYMDQSNMPNNPNSVSKTLLERSPRTPPETLRSNEHGDTAKKGRHLQA